MFVTLYLIKHLLAKGVGAEIKATLMMKEKFGLVGCYLDWFAETCNFIILRIFKEVS